MYLLCCFVLIFLLKSCEKAEFSRGFVACAEQGSHLCSVSVEEFLLCGHREGNSVLELKKKHGFVLNFSSFIFFLKTLLFKQPKTADDLDVSSFAKKKGGYYNMSELQNSKFAH